MRAALIGGIGGFLSFLVQEPHNYAAEQRDMQKAMEEFSSGRMDMAGDFVEMMIVFGVLGLFVGAALAIADEVGSTSAKRFGTKLALGVIAGMVCGSVAGLLGQVAFAGILSVARGGSPSQLLVRLVLMIVARVVGWTVLGALTGLAGGAPSRSLLKCRQGLIGGAIGGFVGGVLFDMAGGVGIGTISRLIGFTAVGACVAGASTLVEERAKVAWVTVLAGRNEGRQYILAKPVTTVGRDELSDIPLYGDVSVAKQHATIRTFDGLRFAVYDSGSPVGTGLNGVRVAQQELHDRDVIQIGGHQLIFSHRAGLMMAPYNAPHPMQPAPYAPMPVSDPGICQFCGQRRDPISGMCACTPAGVSAAPVVSGVSTAILVGVVGPYTSATFRLDTDRTEIGRDASNNIVLDRDPGVSRKHALVLKENGLLVAYDNGSSNGTYINGARIQRQVLKVGDVLHMGGSSFQVAG